MTDRLNPEALEAAAKAARVNWSNYSNWGRADESTRNAYRDVAEAAVSAYLAALPAPRTITTVEEFINQRPEYITALRNTRGTDDQADYHRWQGGAEARRQLAQALGWTVPRNPGETTQPTEGGGE